MVILQSHRTQNMILIIRYISQCICYIILPRHTKSCLLCFFNNPYISPFLIHRIFYLLVSALFLQAGGLLRPKNDYLVWSRGASSARARMQGAGADCRVRTCSKKTDSCMERRYGQKFARSTFLDPRSTFLDPSLDPRSSFLDP